jgi:hypothetical protein
MNIIWMDLNIWDWKATSRYQNFRHIEIWDKRRKLNGTSEKFRLNQNDELTEFDITRFNCSYESYIEHL